MVAVAKFDYNRSIATANRLIDRFGATGAILHTEETGPAWDPDRSVVSHPAIMVRMNYSTTYMAQGLVQQGTYLFYIAVIGLTIVPSLDDKLSFDGQTYTIAGINPLGPAGQIVYYEVNASR